MSAAIRAFSTLMVSLIGLNALPDESKTYCTAELGRVLTKYTEVFDGPSLRTAAGYKFTRKFGLEVAYDLSRGGTAKHDFWRTTEGPTRFDIVHTLGVFGLVEWEISPKLSFLSKFGVTRGKVDYRALDLSRSSPDGGTMTETNIVIVLGAAVPISNAYDFTISVKQRMSANVLGIGDSLDSTTVSMGLRIRL